MRRAGLRRVAHYHTIRMPSAHPPRVDRVFAWMCVLVFVYELGFGGLVPALALYARSFGVSQAAVGLAISCYGLARFLAALPTGRLADGLGRRTTLAAGGVVTLAGNLLCAYASSFAVFLGGRFVAGAGAALVLNGAQIVMADITTRARRGRAMALYQGMFLVASGIGPFPGGLLATRFGLAAPFFTYAVSGALVTTLAWLCVPETKDGRRPAAAAPAEPLPPFGAQIRMLTRHRGLVLVSAVAFVNAVARTGALFSLIPLLGRDRLSLSPERVGAAMALASLVALVLVYPAGTLVDRYGRKLVIVPATLVAALALTLFLLAPSPAWFAAACVVWGLGVGLSAGAPSAYVADVAPPGMNAAAMCAFRMLSDMGYVLGPVVLGLVTDVFSVEAALAVAATLLVLTGLAFARYAPETYR